MSLDTSQLSSVDLTAMGMTDWIDWGYLPSDATDPRKAIADPVADVCTYNAHCTNRKKGVNQIGDFAPIGNVSPQRFRFKDETAHFSWSDGEPVAAAADVRSGVWMGLAGNGFQIIVPAGQKERRFTLYVKTHNARVMCRVALSDHSAASIRDSSLDTFGEPTANKYGTYTINYRAAGPDQILTVKITIQEDIGGANISIFAATLR